MARANAAMPMPTVVAAVQPIPQARASAKPPHGMSLAVKPARIPHPTAMGRDIHGRIMPGAKIPGAAPPFQPAKATRTTMPKFTAPAVSPIAINGRLPAAVRGRF